METEKKAAEEGLRNIFNVRKEPKGKEWKEEPDGSITIIKPEYLAEQLKKLQNNVETLIKSGLNEEILEIYLAFKLKMSIKKVRLMLRHLKDFFNKLIKEEK